MSFGKVKKRDSLQIYTINHTLPLHCRGIKIGLKSSASFAQVISLVGMLWDNVQQWITAEHGAEQ